LEIKEFMRFAHRKGCFFIPRAKGASHTIKTKDISRKVTKSTANTISNQSRGRWFGNKNPALRGTADSTIALRQGGKVGRI
jgi:hypothetical protein